MVTLSHYCYLSFIWEKNALTTSYPWPPWWEFLFYWIYFLMREYLGSVKPRNILINIEWWKFFHQLGDNMWHSNPLASDGVVGLFSLSGPVPELYHQYIERKQYFHYPVMSLFSRYHGGRRARPAGGGDSPGWDNANVFTVNNFLL